MEILKITPFFKVEPIGLGQGGQGPVSCDLLSILGSCYSGPASDPAIASVCWKASLYRRRVRA